MAQSEPRAPVVSGHRLGGQGRPQQPTGWAAVMRLGWWQFGAPTSCLRHSGVHPPPGGQLLCPTGPGARKGGPGRSLLHQADLEGPRGTEGQWPAIPASATAGPGPFQESSEALGLKAVPLLGVRSCGNRDPDPGWEPGRWVGVGRPQSGRPCGPWEGQAHADARPGSLVLTDLAVRVGEEATAAKMWTMAILQRSAAEPVGTKPSDSWAMRDPGPSACLHCLPRPLS